MKILAVLFLLAIAGFVVAQETGEAFIREFTGTVEVRALGSAWTPAETGQRISGDTEISTGFKSTALIVLGNSTLTVRPLTRLSLEELQNRLGNEEVHLYLQSGRVRAEVTPPRGGKIDFTVRSPSVTASVRGTSFDFDGVNLWVDEGVVRFTGSDGLAVYVRAGHSSISDPETGRTAGMMEQTRTALAPAMTTATVENMTVTPAALPDKVDVDYSLNWN